MLLLAAFMPFAVFRLIPIVEAALVQQGIKSPPIAKALQIAGGEATHSRAVQHRGCSGQR